MITVSTHRGDAVGPWLDAVAALRIAVFAEWPYLYAGDVAYERQYLARYAASPRALFVLARDGERVVGASTAVPLADEAPMFQAPFVARGIALDTVFYFGESVLLPDYRGRGLGHRFFDEREAVARATPGTRWTAFCAVLRDDDDPRRPPGHRGNEVFWAKRGYVAQDDMVAELEWPEVGGGEASHRLRFWLRPL